MRELYWLVLIGGLSSHVSKNTKVNIIRVVVQLELGPDVGVALSASRSLVSKLFQLLRCVSGMIFNVLENMRAYSVKFLVNNGSHLSHIVVAPLNLIGVVVGQGFTQDVLHLTDYFLGSLTILAALLKSFVFALVPDRNERSEIALVSGIGQWVTQQVLGLKS